MNRFGRGPFCRFTIEKAPHASGVYVVTLDEAPVYVGQCKDLAERFGPRGYGQIFARNTLMDGQATNCKINRRILEAVRSEKLIELWFHETIHRDEIEAALVRALRPAWNGSQPATRVPHDVQARRGPRGGRAEAFRRALLERLRRAEEASVRSITVVARDLHRDVGGYPGPNHSMPVCCKVMRTLATPRDRVVTTPPKGVGASLAIAYALPRGQVDR